VVAAAARARSTGGAIFSVPAGETAFTRRERRSAVRGHVEEPVVVDRMMAQAEQRFRD